MSRTRRTVALASATVVLVSLTACAQGSATRSDDEGGGVTLQFQSLSDQPATQAAVAGVVEAWNAENPDVQVEIVQAGWDGTYDKLITQFTGGTAPDVIHYEASSISAFALDGYLADLGDFVDPELREDISDDIWESVTVDGQVVAYPSTLQSYLVFANRTLLEQAGAEVPTGSSMTWDQFQEIARATTGDGRYGVAWGLGSPAATMMSLAQGFDGDFFDHDGEGAAIDVAADAELAVPARIHEMAYDDRSVDPTSLTQPGADVLASFFAGQAAMTVQGSFQATTIAADAPEDLDWVVLPPLEGTAGALQAANPQTYSVNVDSEHVEESADFLNFFMDADNLAQVAYADALIPSSAGARERVAEMAGDDEAWATVLASGDGLVGAPFTKVDGYEDWKGTVATPAFQQYLADEISLDQLRSQLTDGWADVSG